MEVQIENRHCHERQANLNLIPINTSHMFSFAQSRMSRSDEAQQEDTTESAEISFPSSFLCVSVQYSMPTVSPYTHRTCIKHLACHSRDVFSQYLFLTDFCSTTNRTGSCHGNKSEWCSPHLQRVDGTKCFCQWETCRTSHVFRPDETPWMTLWCVAWNLFKKPHTRTEYLAVDNRLLLWD